MNRTEFEAAIENSFGISSEHLFARYPEYSVFRHGGSGKWFAVVMRVESQKLGLAPGEMVEIVNLKCEPLLVQGLLSKPGFFPAWHMNKERWISAQLGDAVSDEELLGLAAMSYDLVAPKIKKKTKQNQTVK